MKFSLSWLKDHLNTEASIDQVAEAMTLAGLEVEDIHDPSKVLKPFTVAKVISAAKHPNADKLQVLQVDTVDGPKEIVCGAPNARAGMTTIYAPIGAYVPGLDVTLVEKPVRGVISNGMMCSGAELQIDSESDGILDLADTFTVGTPAASVFGAEPVIDFEVTPNRPDWLGVKGIARDLAAVGIGEFIDTPVMPVAGAFPCPVSVKVDGVACPFFSGRVIRGVKNGPSPNWLQDKLTSVGLKPISVLVDITNYLSIDCARPLHVYDLKKLRGDVLEARIARNVEYPNDLGAGVTTRQSEQLEALNDFVYSLIQGRDCVISDDGGRRAIGIGGIMGGKTTKVDETTTDVFLESAWFDPINTAQTVRDLKIDSDAGYRFARGVDPEFTVPGLELATRLILDMCGGEASEVVTDGAIPERRPDVAFDPAYVAQLSGLALEPTLISAILKALGFGVTTGNPWTVKVPSWRRDVEGRADLVEEVARIHGFNHIPATALLPMAHRPAGVLTALQAKARIARRALAALGFHEAVTWSFMPQERASLFGGGDDALRLANPIASELNCMRPSILPNLLDAAGRNEARGFAGVRLFEIGPVYAGLDPADQKTMIATLRAPAKNRHWSVAGEDGLFALKADLMSLLDNLGVPTGSLQLVQGQNTSYWHPGRSARLQLGPKQIIAEFGEIHPGTIKALGLEGAYIAFEISMGNLPVPKAKSGKSRGGLVLSNLMPLKRDFAFVVPDSLRAGDLIRAVRGADKALIDEVTVFDHYRGQGVPEGHISLGLEITLQPTDKTLTDAEIEAVSARIIASADKIGAKLRA